MSVLIYDGESDLTMPNGSTYSPVELRAVPRFHILGTDKCVIWQDTDGIVTRFRRFADLLHYATGDEIERNASGSLSDEALLTIILQRMSMTPLTVEDVSDAVIETSEQVWTNTDDIALCMDAIIELGGGLKEV